MIIELHPLSIQLAYNYQKSHKHFSILSFKKWFYKRIIGLVTIYKKELSEGNFAINGFLAESFILAAGGPGALYKTSVFRGQPA